MRRTVRPTAQRAGTTAQRSAGPVQRIAPVTPEADRRRLALQPPQRRQPGQGTAKRVLTMPAQPDPAVHPRDRRPQLVVIPGFVSADSGGNEFAPTRGGPVVRTPGKILRPARRSRPTVGGARGR
jgi:hypothetical protein